MTNLPDEQKTPYPSSGSVIVSKEREPSGWPEHRKVPVVEIGKVSETVAEKESLLERVEKEIELQQPVTDEQGQILVTSSSAQQPQIVLPMKQSTFHHIKKLPKKITESIFWLAEWVGRIIKKNPGRTVFRE